MDGNLERTVMLRLKRTAENLKQNGMETHILQRKEEVVPWLKAFIPEGATVAHGGSVTLAECGVMELLKSGTYHYLDRDREGITPEERTECMRQALLSDVYLLSANDLLESGMIYNVDGNGNRTAASIYGPRKVVYVIGENKLVPDFEAAVERVKRTACPANTMRLNCQTYCASKGVCVADDQGITKGCGGSSICNDHVLIRRNNIPGRVVVLLVRERLGY